MLKVITINVREFFEEKVCFDQLVMVVFLAEEYLVKMNKRSLALLDLELAYDSLRKALWGATFMTAV